MPKYKLRGSGPLDVVDGPMTGKKFLPGVEYDEIPEQDKVRFEVIKQRPAQKTQDKKAEAGGSPSTENGGSK